MALKLGSGTGSVVNHLMSRTAAPPVVGEGATILFWTDRAAGTVVKVSPSGKTAWIREDRAIRTDSHGMSEAQAYRYEADPDGRVYVARLTTRGWRAGGSGVMFGVRRAYHDFSF